jgi:hypothetical protein
MSEVILRMLCRFLRLARRDVFSSGEKRNFFSAVFNASSGFTWAYNN